MVVCTYDLIFLTHWPPREESPKWRFKYRCPSDYIRLGDTPLAIASFPMKFINLSLWNTSADEFTIFSLIQKRKKRKTQTLNPDEYAGGRSHQGLPWPCRRKCLTLKALHIKALFQYILKGCGNVGMHGNCRLSSLQVLMFYVNENLLGELIGTRHLGHRYMKLPPSRWRQSRAQRGVDGASARQNNFFENLWSTSSSSTWWWGGGVPGCVFTGAQSSSLIKYVQNY